jgi:hypothetical protein
MTMANYQTKAISIGDITVTVSKAGKTGAERVAALLKAIAEKIVDPGYGRPEGGSPDQSLPGGGGSPDNTLPGGGESPDQGLPPSGSTKPGSDAPRPDQGLPGQELADFLKENADAIAKEVLKGTLCDPAATPKK